MPNRSVNISEDELAELRLKAKAYDNLIAKRSAGGKKSSANMTPEERSARAKKAALARAEKYRQKK